jgi:hypothetical protein
VTFNVSLERGQREALEQIAEDKGTTPAELVRRAVARLVKATPPKRRKRRDAVAPEWVDRVLSKLKKRLEPLWHRADDTVLNEFSEEITLGELREVADVLQCLASSQEAEARSKAESRPNDEVRQ